MEKKISGIQGREADAGKKKKAQVIRSKSPHDVEPAVGGRPLPKSEYPDSYDYGAPAAVVGRAVLRLSMEFTEEGEVMSYTSDEFEVEKAKSYQDLVDQVIGIVMSLAHDNESIDGLEVFNIETDEESGNLSCIVTTQTKVCNNVTMSKKPSFRVETDEEDRVILYKV